MVFVALLAAFLAVVTINGFDTKLTPQTKALKIVPPNPYSPQENVYLAIGGFDAPHGESLVQTGLTKIAEHEKTNKGRPMLANPKSRAAALIKSPRGISFKGNIDFCKPVFQSCWSGIENHKIEIQTLLKQNNELYQRYLKLHEMKGFYEATIPSLYKPVFFVPSQIRSLFIANLALRMKSGQANQQKAALADLHNDILLWTRILKESSGTTFSMALTIRALQADYALLADMMADANIHVSDPTKLEEIIGLSESIEWKIGSAITHDFRDFIKNFENPSIFDLSKGNPTRITDVQSRFFRYFFQVNATENLIAAITIEKIKMADAGPQQYFTARTKYKRWVAETTPMGTVSPYNPLGLLLASNIAKDSYEDLLLFTYDAQAFLRLIRLGYEIYSQGVELKSVPTFMKDRPEWSTHPVDGKLFTWDKATKKISVKMLSQQSKDRRSSIVVRTR